MTRRRLAWSVGGALGLAALAGAFAWAFQASGMMSDTAIGLHGWIAMAIGLLGVAAVGGGLMWLAFYSARAGWDDIDREP